MKDSDILMDTSILYRCTQKYYDKCLEAYDINFSHLPILIQIYEHEGIAMNRLADMCGYDKGTITKSIQKLMQSNYVAMASDEADKRVKRLYTTDQTKGMITQLYMVRKDWWEHLTQDMEEADITAFSRIQSKLCENARSFDDVKRGSLKLFEMQKVSFRDYPGNLACVLYTGGCNFRCPFCKNSNLVYVSEGQNEISSDTIFSYLSKRAGLIDCVTLSGGEPLMHELRPFLSKLHDLGYRIKLDTNGAYPAYLKELVRNGYVDYVAMDVKNGWTRYGESAGRDDLDFHLIQESIDFLKQGLVPYEFRTTIVKELHEKSDLLEMKELLRGAKKCVLQVFEDNGQIIQSGLHPVNMDTMRTFQAILAESVACVQIKEGKERDGMCMK